MEKSVGMRKNAFEISDVIGNVIGNWLYDQIVQQDKKEVAIIERLELIETILVHLSAGHTRQSRVSENGEESGQESGT